MAPAQRLEAWPDAGASAAFHVGSVIARAGEIASGFLEVPEASDAGTRIPITIVNGVGPGPVLAVIAGIHGFEYPPILALQRMWSCLDPAMLVGTVILVHIANLPAFLSRTVFTGPVDGKNLNRCFPGRQSGTQSERIAYVLTTEVIERANYLLDLHSGDACEALQPYVAYKQGGRDLSVDHQSRQMAIASGLDLIVVRNDLSADAAASVTCANTGATRGKPAVQIEMGELGTMDPGYVGRIEQAVLSVMRHLAMLSGQVLVAEHPVFVISLVRVLSQVEGLFFPSVQRGQIVTEGQSLGQVTDYFGRRVFEARAPAGGIVLYMIRTPPVNDGELLVTIGQVN